MQRITSLATCREIGGLACLTSQACPWKRGSSTKQCRRWACMWRSTLRSHAGETWRLGRRLNKSRSHGVVFAGQKYRLYCSERDEQRSPSVSPSISVVGIPDPITWIRCKAVMYLIELCFEIGVTSEDFDIGVKQALVHVSNMMSHRKFHELRGIVSKEMLDYIEKKCNSLTDEQRQQLAISVDDIIFLLPEDVSFCVHQNGKKFCYVVMRFWLLSTIEGPEDPEATKIFKVTSDEESGPQKKIVTAVYEFHRDLSRGASPDWTVTNVWHWHWKVAE